MSDLTMAVYVVVAIWATISFAWVVSMTTIVAYELRFERIKVAVCQEKERRLQVERKLDEVLSWLEREYSIQVKPESAIERAFTPRS